MPLLNAAMTKSELAWTLHKAKWLVKPAVQLSGCVASVCSINVPRCVPITMKTIMLFAMSKH
jgi:hypothetical protein